MSSFFDPTVPLPVSESARQRQEFERKTQYDASPLHSNYRGDCGLVIRCDPDTCAYDVATDRNGGDTVDLFGIPRLLQDPSDKSMLPVGTQVAISYDFGYPVIVGVLPFTAGKEFNDHSQFITGESGFGGTDGALTGDSEGNFRLPNTPRDLGPGDWAQVKTLGNFIAALEGGVSIIGGSAHSQVRTHLLNDLVEVVCRNYRMTSDMGISEIKNENGAITWSFRGGSDFESEAASGAENWTIRIDLGAKGDLFHFELTTPTGATLFKLHVNADGKVELFAKDSIDVFTGNNFSFKALQNVTEDIKGSETRMVRSNQDETVRGNRTTTVSGSDTTSVANDLTRSVKRNETVSVGGQLIENISGGDVAFMKPGDLARRTTLNAGWKINIGDPLSLANPVALAGWTLNTFTGDIINKVTVKGDIKNSTTLGDILLDTLKGDINIGTLIGTIALSGTKIEIGGASEPIVCGDKMMEIFSELLDIVQNLTVPTPTGPSGPTIAQKPQLIALKAKVDQKYALSDFIFCKKSALF